MSFAFRLNRYTLRKKLNCIHVTSSYKATFYELHKNRGLEALEEINILPRFRGTAVYDYWIAHEL